eukprot:gb/GFBE01068674.1/.p1 GENE.gb/GFBE01068674.1/~~gb/GFBE01068674.1/.p1  ORF type:complete len:794 (+),score=111.61 gb/GFBE01068674.1/:1-2382(+)
MFGPPPRGLAPRSPSTGRRRSPPASPRSSPRSSPRDGPAASPSHGRSWQRSNSPPRHSHKPVPLGLDVEASGPCLQAEEVDFSPASALSTAAPPSITFSPLSSPEGDHCFFSRWSSPLATTQHNIVPAKLSTAEAAGVVATSVVRSASGNSSQSAGLSSCVSAADFVHRYGASFAEEDSAAQAIAQAADAIREETVRASCARLLLEGQSRRLESQLARAVQLLKPLLAQCDSSQQMPPQSQQQLQQLLQQLPLPPTCPAPSHCQLTSQLQPTPVLQPSASPRQPTQPAQLAQPMPALLSPRPATRIIQPVQIKPSLTLQAAAALGPRTVVRQVSLPCKTVVLPYAMHTAKRVHVKVAPASGAVQNSCEASSSRCRASSLEREFMAEQAAERKHAARKRISEAVNAAAGLLGEPSLPQLKEARDRCASALAEGRAAQLPEAELTTAETHRRRLHNAFQDMKGQLRVYCRVRPLLSAERKRGETEALRVLGSDRLEVKTTGAVFDFDGVFAPGSQEDIFEDCRDAAQSAIDGHNVAVFSYGQTGAGKTYTMYGTSQEEGIAQRMIREVFLQVENLGQDRAVAITGSMIELYNNHLVDLLRPVDRHGRQHPPLRVQLNKDRGVQVDGLAQESSKNAEELKAIFERGLTQRSIAGHSLNSESSRSHVIFTVKLQARARCGELVTSKLHFCDLGGCERLKKTEAEGDRRLEAIEINKSLSALGDVIEAVAGKRKHIPYRNHKLTQLLQDALGGSAKAMMYVNCSPAQSCVRETVVALQLATRAKNVVNQRAETLRRDA